MAKEKVLTEAGLSALWAKIKTLTERTKLYYSTNGTVPPTAELNGNKTFNVDCDTFTGTQTTVNVMRYSEPYNPAYAGEKTGEGVSVTKADANVTITQGAANVVSDAGVVTARNSAKAEIKTSATTGATFAYGGQSYSVSPNYTISKIYAYYTNNPTAPTAITQAELGYTSWTDTTQKLSDGTTTKKVKMQEISAGADVTLSGMTPNETYVYIIVANSGHKVYTSGGLKELSGVTTTSATRAGKNINKSIGCTVRALGLQKASSTGIYIK